MVSGETAGRVGFDGSCDRRGKRGHRPGLSREHSTLLPSVEAGYALNIRYLLLLVCSTLERQVAALVGLRWLGHGNYFSFE